MYFQAFPGHFYCMRGPSLVELTGHDNSVPDNMVHVYICVLLHL